MIYTLQKSPQRLRLRNILQQRFAKRGMSLETKNLVLEIMEEAKSLDFVREQMATMEVEIEALVTGLENVTGEANYVLRLLLERLKIQK